MMRSYEQDGKCTVSGSYDKTVRLWDAERCEVSGFGLDDDDDKIWWDRCMELDDLNPSSRMIPDSQRDECGPTSSDFSRVSWTTGSTTDFLTYAFPHNSRPACQLLCPPSLR